MSNQSQAKKVPLTAGRYKLVMPCLPGSALAAAKSRVFEHEKESTLPSSPGFTQPSKVAPGQRLFLPPLTNAHVKSQIELVKQYFSETEVQITMEKITAQLLQNSVLPYNPYPGYIKRFQKISERFHTKRKSLVEIRQVLDIRSLTVDNSYLMRVNIPDAFVWGLEHIISHVNAKAIEKFRPLLVSTISNESASNHVGKEVSVFKSISGPGIFGQSFYDDMNFIILRVSMFITSPDLKLAAKIFSRLVIEDVKLTILQQSQKIVELVLNIGSKSDVKRFPSSELYAALSSGGDDQSRIEKQISESVVAKQSVVLRLLAFNSSDQLFDKFILVSKVYELLYLQTAPDQLQKTKNKTTQNIATKLILSTLPYQALLEGVFLDLADAELYISTLQKHHSPQNPSKMRRNISKPYPFDPDILNPVVQLWQSQVASTVLEHSAIVTVHRMLLLHLARKRPKTFSKHTEEELAIQICRFYSGTVANVYTALTFCEALPHLLDLSESRKDSTNMEMLQKLKKFLTDMFDRCFCSISLEKRILTDALDSVYDSALIGGMVNMKKHQVLTGCLTVAVLSFTEDALDSCPTLSAFKGQINATIPHLVPTFTDVPEQSKNQHGVKNTSWLNVDVSRVDKAKSITTSQAPPAVATQYAMLQYCVDMHLDSVWKEFLEFLLLKANFLPPNPYPYLITFFRKANMSVQVLFEAESTRVNELIQQRLVQTDGVNELYNVSETDAYGKRSALILFNSRAFRQAGELGTSVFMAPPGDTSSGFPMQLGNFRLTICSGLTGSSSYYGCLSPLLLSVDVDEHFFLSGLQNRLRDAFSLLSSAVVSNLRRLRAEGSIMHQARFGQVQLDLFVLIDSPARFESEFTAAVGNNQTIIVSFFFPLAWRYILVTKRLLVYYVDNVATRTTRMFPHTSGAEKRGVTVFLHPNDANFVMRPGRVLSHSLGPIVKAAWPSRDWSRLIRQLASHAQLMLSGSGAESRTDLFADEMAGSKLSHSLAAFCYRYFNGLTGQLDYVLSLNTTIENILVHAVAAMDEKLDLTSVLQTKLLDKMMDEYMIKIKEVTSRSSTLTPSSFADYILNKLRSVAVRDPNSGSLYVRYEQESIIILRQVAGCITFLRDILAEDLINVSPVVFKLLETVAAS